MNQTSEYIFIYFIIIKFRLVSRAISCRLLPGFVGGTDRTRPPFEQGLFSDEVKICYGSINFNMTHPEFNLSSL